jgi:hypothetical protein
MEILTEEERTKLEDQGWVVECESPLEIKHEESNSYATNVAAEMLIQLLLDEGEDEPGEES